MSDADGGATPREGSLDAPTRHPIDWLDSDFYDEEKLDEELRRVFDICHGCRRCFNLCDSFPRLFDLIDEAETGELDSVDSADFKPVVDACTLCDMCFMTKCPYVPPHEFNLDFPHLMLRYRAVEAKKDGVGWNERQLTQTDRNGRLAGKVAGLANWGSDRGNKLTRPVIEAVAGVHREAYLPKYAPTSKSFVRQAETSPPAINTSAPAHGREAILYATCFVNYNKPDTGVLAQRILAQNGVKTSALHPACCGMPQLEQGEIGQVADLATTVAAAFRPHVDAGKDIIALTPSCALMLKFEWPLIVPDDEDVKALSAATRDITEYIVDIAKNEGLADGLSALPDPVALHLACHARAQNMGQKAAEMLRLIPEVDLKVIERCSGHGGSWGIMKENFDTAIKVGRPVARQAKESRFIVSECPLAADHILQGVEKQLDEGEPAPSRTYHPVEMFALAYGLAPELSS
ncbi:MAG: glycerol-3-phosphate dehydrogenase [Alphaproteobacteria bacterium]|nr:glycerol-3-phosphate dehydrogenase [Alphaproteobacteria bacterium]